MIKIDKNRFTHCLRMAVAPDGNENDRINAAINFCLQYGVNNVMLFINAEEFNLGHITIDEAKPWVETIKLAKRRFNSHNISVSLNPWIEMGHLDRGRRLKDDQDFMTVEDFNGQKSNLVACPMDEKWQAYYFEFTEYLLREIKPDVIWIEDDFRFHNHGELEYGGCFCDLHINELNKILNKTYSKRELIAKIFSKGNLNEERAAWLSLCRDNLKSLAEKIGRLVKAVSSETEVGLMSSTPWAHCMEARDWNGILYGLSQGNCPINRIHLPCYLETTGKEYLYAFNCVSMAVRALSPKETLIYPEIENSAFSTYAKDSRFLKFQIEAAAPLCISGMTYDIFDFVGNGVIERYGYGKAIQQVTPLLQALMDLKLQFSELSGIIIPVSEESCYKQEIKTGWQDLYPKEFMLAGYFATLGINYRYSKKKKFKKQIIALNSGNIRLFNNVEINDLFQNNFIFLDAGAALYLAQKDLNDLIGLKKIEILKADTDAQSYEECEAGLVNGIKNFRASAQAAAGDCIFAEYEDGKTVFSGFYNSRMKRLSDAIVYDNNCIVLPLFIGDLQIKAEKFHDLRRNGILNAFLAAKTDTLLICTDYTSICPYVYKNEDDITLIITNGTVNFFDGLDLILKGIIPKTIERICSDGSNKSVDFSFDNGRLKIFEYLEYLSTSVFLITE